MLHVGGVQWSRRDIDNAENGIEYQDTIATAL